MSNYQETFFYDSDEDDLQADKIHTLFLPLSLKLMILMYKIRSSRASHNARDSPGATVLTLVTDLPGDITNLHTLVSVSAQPLFGMSWWPPLATAPPVNTSKTSKPLDT